MNPLLKTACAVLFLDDARREHEPLGVLRELVVLVVFQRGLRDLEHQPELEMGEVLGPARPDDVGHVRRALALHRDVAHPGHRQDPLELLVRGLHVVDLGPDFRQFLQRLAQQDEDAFVDVVVQFGKGSTGLCHDVTPLALCHQADQRGQGDLERHRGARIANGRHGHVRDDDGLQRRRAVRRVDLPDAQRRVVNDRTLLADHGRGHGAFPAHVAQELLHAVEQGDPDRPRGPEALRRPVALVGLHRNPEERVAVDAQQVHAVAARGGRFGDAMRGARDGRIELYEVPGLDLVRRGRRADLKVT